MIKVIAIETTKNPEISRVLFQNADELALSTGKATKMIHSEACFNNKLTLVEGQEIKGYEIVSEKSTTPSYEGHKVFEATGLYYSSKLVKIAK